ncbi:MAG: hypothetical protein GX557_11890, partial [Chloroflexi bacterium]|nr:hypothetical protein [Chloroflexota bacterium]
VIETRANALVVPNRALRRDAEGKFVELLQGGQPVKQYVVTGVASNEYTEVLSGLDENQEIIVAKPRESVLTTGFFGG